MADLRDKVKTVVLLMMENRSFDHMLGHLTLENPQLDINGLRVPLQQYNNIYNASNYSLYNPPHDVELDFDVPHEFSDVTIQMKKNPVNGKFTMQGFVEAFAGAQGPVVNPECLPMGFFNSSQVPVTDFLAKEFCVCDNWFCPLPSSTQPNRTMAFSGDSQVHRTKLQPLPIPNDVFNWMNKNGIRWRVYYDGFPFFCLYPKLWPFVFSDNFRRYENFYSDLLHEAEDHRPNLIIVEPNYGDAPHFGSKHPNDNHCPLAIGWGEDFLRRTYEAITANKAMWESTVMILYYDEHGGFYDHVAPPEIPYTTKGRNPHTFQSLGPRIPAVIISPLVAPGSVSHDLYDHTSVLQFLAEIFTPGKSYSATVNQRKKAGIASLASLVTEEISLETPLLPPFQLNVQTALGKPVAIPPHTDMQLSFENAALEIIKTNPAGVAKKFPELFQWRDVVSNGDR